MMVKFTQITLILFTLGRCQSDECSKWSQNDFKEAFKNFGQRITEKRTCVAYNADGIGLSNTVRLEEGIPDPTVFKCKSDTLTVELPKAAVCMSMRRDETADKIKDNDSKYTCRSDNGPYLGIWQYLSDTSASLEISLKDGSAKILSDIADNAMLKEKCEKEWKVHLSGQFKPNIVVLLATSINGLELKAAGKSIKLNVKGIDIPSAKKCWLTAEENDAELTKLADILNMPKYVQAPNKPKRNEMSYFKEGGFYDAIHWFSGEGAWQYGAEFNFKKPTVECVSCPDPDVVMLTFKGLNGPVIGKFRDAAKLKCFKTDREDKSVAKVKNVDIRAFIHTSGAIDVGVGKVDFDRKDVPETADSACNKVYEAVAKHLQEKIPSAMSSVLSRTDFSKFSKTKSGSARDDEVLQGLNACHELKFKRSNN